MLKKVSKLISPELLKILAEMGHGDEIVIADANFPGHNVNNRVVRADGVKIPALLKGILELVPLDTYAEENVVLMSVVKGDNYTPVIWNEYDKILDKYEKETKRPLYIERFDFYDRAKKAYAVVVTGEESLYANIILKKGVIK